MLFYETSAKNWDLFVMSLTKYYGNYRNFNDGILRKIAVRSAPSALWQNNVTFSQEAVKLVFKLSIQYFNKKNIEIKEGDSEKMVDFYFCLKEKERESPYAGSTFQDVSSKS